jgi:hypothetical protein
MPRALVEGETIPVDVTLYDGEGAAQVAVNGTGLTISLILRDRAGGLVPFAGKVAWLVAASGTVRYSPAITDLKAAQSPYQARFKVTDGNSDDAYYPNAEADVWEVRR